MTRLVLIASIWLAIAAPALAQQVPKKFQGNWVDRTQGPITIGASTIEFPGPGGSKYTITSIKPSESGDLLLVRYGPITNPVAEVFWYLTQVYGRDVLIQVRSNSPSDIFVYQRR